jgi:hypothetical protein
MFHVGKGREYMGRTIVLFFEIVKGIENILVL